MGHGRLGAPPMIETVLATSRDVPTSTGQPRLNRLPGITLDHELPNHRILKSFAVRRRSSDKVANLVAEAPPLPSASYSTAPVVLL
jgi:hypothetical protein